MVCRIYALNILLNSSHNAARIETQDSLFSSAEYVERFIEIGPTNVLGGLAKKTIASKYAASDTFRSLDRQILSFPRDANEICHIYPDAVSSPATVGQQISPDAGPRAPDISKVTTPALSVAPIRPISIEVPDIAIDPVYIIRVIVAKKLKKSFEDVHVEKSIKDLSAGTQTSSHSLLRC